MNPKTAEIPPGAPHLASEMWDGPPQPVILTLSAAEGGSAQSKDPDALDIPSAARTIPPTEPVRATLNAAQNLRICFLAVIPEGNLLLYVSFVILSGAWCVSAKRSRRTCG